MIRDFSKDELETVESERDTELTLGSGTLLVLGGGLLLLCLVCFGLGYFAGHRGSPESGTAVLPTSNAKASVTPTSSGSKPGAAGQTQARPQTQAAVTDSSDSPDDSRPSLQPLSATSASTGSTPAQVKPTLDAQVRPALVGQTVGVQPASALHVQPAMTQVQGWMVQIAAVSHPEDAAVLVDALRKRGYTVTARRDVGDNLIHVQTGPFVNRNDANAMRQKLLSDGYNAIVQ
jgi:cell division septation protein DedD